MVYVLIKTPFCSKEHASANQDIRRSIINARVSVQLSHRYLFTSMKYQRSIHVILIKIGPALVILTLTHLLFVYLPLFSGRVANANALLILLCLRAVAFSALFQQSLIIGKGNAFFTANRIKSSIIALKGAFVGLDMGLVEKENVLIAAQDHF